MTSQTLTIYQPIPKSLEKVVAVAMLIPAILVFVNVFSVLYPAKAADLPTTDENLLVNLVNEQRTEHGLKPLTYNSQLHDAAEAKAEDMLARGYFDHISPTGKTPWQFIDESGYNYVKAGENLAIDFTTVEGPIPAWMNSPTHRANILKSDYEETGIAEVHGKMNGRETIVVVQEFGTRTFSVTYMLSQLVK